MSLNHWIYKIRQQGGVILPKNSRVNPEAFPDLEPHHHNLSTAMSRVLGLLSVLDVFTTPSRELRYGYIRVSPVADLHGSTVMDVRDRCR